MTAKLSASAEDPQQRAERRPDPWRRELIIAVAMLGFGFFVLPAAIYGFGVRVVGTYAGDNGLLGLAESIWVDLLRLAPAAWILVLSPYALVQALRLTRRLWRAPKSL